MTSSDVQLQRFVALRDHMHQLSRKLFNNYWQDGLEFFLFRCMHGLENSRSMRAITPHDIHMLVYLSRSAGGWVMWDDEENRASFVPEAEWLRIYIDEFGDFGGLE